MTDGILLLAGDLHTKPHGHKATRDLGLPGATGIESGNAVKWAEPKAQQASALSKQLFVTSPVARKARDARQSGCMRQASIFTGIWSAPRSITDTLLRL